MFVHTYIHTHLMFVLDGSLLGDDARTPQLLLQQVLGIFDLLHIALALIAHSLQAPLHRRLLLLAGVLRALQRLVQASIFLLHFEDAVVVGALRTRRMMRRGGVGRRGRRWKRREEERGEG
jgi:hypothetical protein